MFTRFIQSLPDLTENTLDEIRRGKDRIRDEYHNKTIHLPRKKKKRRRKELIIDWNFYSSMELFHNNMLK